MVNGTATWFVCAELETVTQFVPRPAVELFVCDCNTQPVWSTGQEIKSWPDTLLTLMAACPEEVGRPLTCAEFVLSPTELAALTT